MIKIDLITGFLGSGKTTFIKEYAKFLLGRGEKICILENDYGAINVDMMLLQELRGDNCELEMVAGGCDYDCHKRRFKTKLISMGMCGYTRVIIEPSGIFDVDEFFDALYEEPLDRWYEIGNVIAVVNAKNTNNLSFESECILASQVANAGKIVFSRMDECTAEDIETAVGLINSACEKVKCKREFNYGREIYNKEYLTIGAEEWLELSKCGYIHTSYVKLFDIDSSPYNSLYYMNKGFEPGIIEEKSKELFENTSFGNVIRVKGFAQNENDEWVQINVTKDSSSIEAIAEGQDVVIVIGEKLNEELINNLFE